MNQAAWREVLAGGLEVLDLHLGRTGWAGLGMLCAAALVAVMGLPPLNDHARQAEARWRELEASAVVDTRQQAPSPGATASPLAMPPLPAKAELASIGARLMREAAQAGLSVRGAEYRAGSTPSGPHQDIAFDAEGSYVAARSFINAMVSQQQGLALRGLSLKKEGPDANAMLKLRFEWRLFLKEAP